MSGCREPCVAHTGRRALNGVVPGSPRSLAARRSPPLLSTPKRRSTAMSGRATTLAHTTATASTSLGARRIARHRAAAATATAPPTTLAHEGHRRSPSASANRRVSRSAHATKSSARPRLRNNVKRSGDMRVSACSWSRDLAGGAITRRPGGMRFRKDRARSSRAHGRPGDATLVDGDAGDAKGRPRTGPALRAHVAEEVNRCADPSEPGNRDRRARPSRGRRGPRARSPWTRGSE